MDHLVKVVMDYLAEVDNVVLVNLVLPVLLNLKSAVV